MSSYLIHYQIPTYLIHNQLLTYFINYLLILYLIYTGAPTTVPTPVSTTTKTDEWGDFTSSTGQRLISIVYIIHLDTMLYHTHLSSTLGVRHFIYSDITPDIRNNS